MIGDDEFAEWEAEEDPGKKLAMALGWAIGIGVGRVNEAGLFGELLIVPELLRCIAAGLVTIGHDDEMKLVLIHNDPWANVSSEEVPQ